MSSPARRTSSSCADVGLGPGQGAALVALDEERHPAALLRRDVDGHAVPFEDGDDGPSDLGEQVSDRAAREVRRVTAALLAFGAPGPRGPGEEALLREAREGPIGMDAADLPQERLHRLARLQGLVDARERAAQAGQAWDVGEQPHGQGQPFLRDVGALPLRELGGDLGARAEPAVGAGVGELAKRRVGDRLLASDPLEREELGEEPALPLHEVHAARAVGAVLHRVAHRLPPCRAVALGRCHSHAAIAPLGLVTLPMPGPAASRGRHASRRGLRRRPSSRSVRGRP